MIDNISAVIITFNSENTIYQTLESLKDFSEIIIYDSESTDKTVEIAKSFQNVRIFSGEFKGFGKTKNLAIGFSSNSWIFSIDSDEFIDEVLVQEIKNLELSNPNKAFKLKRDNFVLGKKIKYSGLGNDWLIRIFNKDVHRFANKPVHEFIKTSKQSQIEKIQNSFSHTAVTDSSQFLYKIAKYSKLGSPQKKLSITHILLKMFFSFIKTYFLKLGFLDGWRGLLISVSNANGRFYKYIYSYQ